MQTELFLLIDTAFVPFDHKVMLSQETVDDSTDEPEKEFVTSLVILRHEKGVFDIELIFFCKKWSIPSSYLLRSLFLLLR